MKSAATETFVIEGCILSYPHLFKPQAAMGGGDPKFSAALLVSAAVAEVVYRAAMDLANNSGFFQNREQDQPTFGWPVVAANTKPKYASDPRLAALYVINSKASVDYPPQVIGVDRQPVLDRGQVYAGCEVAAGIRLYTYNNMGKIGVSVGLAAIMKTGDGAPLAGDAVDAQTLFGGVQAQAPSAAPASFPGGAPAPVLPGNPFQTAPAATQPAFGMPTPPFMQS